MEKFGWLVSRGLDANTGMLRIVAGEGFCTMNSHPDAYATISQMRNEDRSGMLLSATALVALRKDEDLRFVLLKRSDDAQVAPGLWQFPAGRCAPYESPALTAQRELGEEVVIKGVGNPDWADIALSNEGSTVFYSTPEGDIKFKGDFIFVENTMEFYTPMELDVASLDAIHLSDREEWGREVGAFTIEELKQMDVDGKLTASAASIFNDGAAHNMARMAYVLSADKELERPALLKMKA